jgi:hypothetical protein
MAELLGNISQKYIKNYAHKCPYLKSIKKDLTKMPICDKTKAAKHIKIKIRNAQLPNILHFIPHPTYYIYLITYYYNIVL